MNPTSDTGASPLTTPAADSRGRRASASDALASLRDAPASPESWSRELLALQSAVAAAGSDFDRILGAVVDGALRVMPHAAGAIVEMREESEIVYRAASGTSADKVGLRLRLEGSLSGHCVQTGEVQMCNDTETDPRVDREACRQVGVRSMIVVPLPFQGTYVGVLKVYAAMPRAFDSRDLLTAQLLAGPIAMGLASAAHADAAHARDEADRRLAATFEQAAVGLALVSPDGRFVLVNDRYCEITGYSRAEMLAAGFQQITHPEDLEADLQQLESLLAGRTDRYSMEKRYVRKDGSNIWVTLTVSLVRKAGGAPDFIVAVAEDISGRKAAEEAASHDGLTGLLNRRGLIEQLQLALGRNRVAGRPLAVAYLDLDGFKAINDRYGHGEGDRCLKKVANAIQTMLPASASVGRVGGDEFVLFFPSGSQVTAVELLQDMRDAIAAAVKDQPWRLAASVGAVFVRTEVSLAPEQVIAAADSLMYRAKQIGSDQPLIAPLGA